MSLTSKKTADLDTSATVKAAQRTWAANSAAVANATSAARNAAVAAQNAAGLAQAAAQNAAVIAAGAARSASDAAQMAADRMTKGARGVKQGVYTARIWTAPRLDSAADYCTTTLAPTVSSALRATARQVRPTETKSAKKSSVLTWSVLGVSVLAALGAVAALARYRYQAATAVDSETAGEEVPGDSTGSQPAPATSDGTGSAAPTTTDPATETPANGRVTSPGR
jgi:hypothetical protein